MARRTFVRIVVVTIITVVLAGASLIVTRNAGGVAVDAPSGFLH